MGGSQEHNPAWEGRREGLLVSNSPTQQVALGVSLSPRLLPFPMGIIAPTVVKIMMRVYPDRLSPLPPPVWHSCWQQKLLHMLSLAGCTPPPPPPRFGLFSVRCACVFAINTTPSTHIFKMLSTNKHNPCSAGTRCKFWYFENGNGICCCELRKAHENAYSAPPPRKMHFSKEKSEKIWFHLKLCSQST